MILNDTELVGHSAFGTLLINAETCVRFIGCNFREMRICYTDNDANAPVFFMCAFIGCTLIGEKKPEESKLFKDCFFHPDCINHAPVVP